MKVLSRADLVERLCGHRKERPNDTKTDKQTPRHGDPELLKQARNLGMSRSRFGYFVLVRDRGMSKAEAAKLMGVRNGAVCMTAKRHGDPGYTGAGLVAQVVHQAAQARSEKRRAAVRLANKKRAKRAE